MNSKFATGLNSSPKPSPIKLPQNLAEPVNTSPVKAPKTNVIGKPIEIIKGKYLATD
jgi:hypothetical protein